MGKDLHYSIRPFIENAIRNHHIVDSITPLQSDNFYAYKIHRKNGLPDVTLVLSDDYYLSSNSIENKPEILKEGGFLLKAKPEGGGIETSVPELKLGVGRLRKFLGALNKRDVWTFEPKEE